ncbi:MAG: LysR family transcriptional regulator [Pseudomonadota bacterium]
MKWQSFEFDWNHARAFLATAEEGSLSAAARALGQTQPTLGRQVSALEEELGIVLFERVGRGLALTPAGESLRSHIAEMREAAERVSLTAAGLSDDVSGRVAITASDIYSVFLLPTMLKGLRLSAPKLRIDIVAANDLRDIQRREADIAIRHVRPEEPDLFARKIADGQGFFYGSSEYLDREGRPQSVEDLKRHRLIAFGEPKQSIDYLDNLGVALTEDQFEITSENGLVCWEFAQRGYGLFIMDDLIARATPGMERVLPEAPSIRFPVWLTTHRELQTSRKIRLVFDHLATELSTRFRT